MSKKKLLIVGVGGIGCEAIISVLQIGFNNLVLVDLDHIESSNLNRQFLFTKEDINQKKAEIAAKNLQYLFPRASTELHTKSILDISAFPTTFYRGIDLIISALDNAEARKHLNMIARLLKKPFIDSGSQGFQGQITPIISFITPCYECFTNSESNTDENGNKSNDEEQFEFSESDNEEKILDITGNTNELEKKIRNTGEVIPICSIRSIPSEPVHCAIWAKELIITEMNEIMNNNLNSILDTITDEIQNVVNEKVIEATINLLEENGELKKESENELQSMKNSLISSISQFITTQINDDKNDVVIKYDKENKELVEIITLASNIKATVFNLEILNSFNIKGLLSEIREAFISTNATIGCMLALMAKDILFNQKRMSRNNYWINQGMNIVMNRTMATKPDPNCKVCKRKVLRIKRKLLDNDATWFFDIWLKKQLSIKNKINKRVKTSSIDNNNTNHKEGDGEFVISYCNNDIVQMEEDLKDVNRNMIEILRLGKFGDFFYLDHDENKQKFYTVLIT